MDRAASLSDRRQVLSGHQFTGLDHGLGDVLFLQERAREHERKADYLRRLAGSLIDRMAGSGCDAAPDALEG